MTELTLEQTANMLLAMQKVIEQMSETIVTLSEIVNDQNVRIERLENVVKAVTE